MKLPNRLKHTIICGIIGYILVFTVAGTTLVAIVGGLYSSLSFLAAKSMEDEEVDTR